MDPRRKVAPKTRSSSIFLRRKVGVVFMRVNSKCAHQARPPSRAGGLSEEGACRLWCSRRNDDIDIVAHPFMSS
jgi:hypothetical protein